MIRAELDKRFGVREVLRRAKLEVAAGSVHALVGENGAGKSTLVKIVAGVLAADGGTLEIDGRAVDVRAWTRRAARAAGVGIVQQHGAFAGTLSVVENAVLGAEPGLVMDLAPAARALKELGEKIGLPVDPWARADRLPLGAAQRAEIVAALHAGAKLLVLDEPTAVLTPPEVDGLLKTLRELAASGTTIVLVTHKLDEVRAVADAVTVLRAGETVGTKRAERERERFDVGEIARMMVGGEVQIGKGSGSPGDEQRLEVKLPGIEISVRAGELVGVAGVDGNGQRELALAIAGLERAGSVKIAGKDVSRATTAQRLAAGLAYVPEDRHHGGLVLGATAAENIALGRRDVTGRFAIDRAAVAKLADEQISVLDVRPPDKDAIARALSGGNQQKLVIGRELSRPGLRAVIAAQPTRGVDLGAVARIHDRLRAVAAAGAGVLVISADLDELLVLCHRITVLLRGKLVGELAASEPDARARLGAMMTGASA
jgi:simple sugar transport system ATP-binding protein